MIPLLAQIAAMLRQPFIEVPRKHSEVVKLVGDLANYARELEAERDEAIIALDVALRHFREKCDRLEQVETENAELREKLAVAREALEDMWDQFSYDGNDGGLSALEACRDALAKLGEQP